MDVDIVDKDGKPLPISRIMLHHIVFLNAGDSAFPRHDQTCGTFTMWDSVATLPAVAERFYAAGEERAQMQLPPGYGYRIEKDDTWIITYMLMNHRQLPDKAYIQYHMTIETGTPLQSVTPYWLDIDNCMVDPIYNIPGRGRQGSVDTRSRSWTIPTAGRLVSGLGHMHGGGKQLTVTEPTCGGRELARFDPTWGLPGHPFYHVRPVLHEPGPINMTRMETPTGIPLAAGDRITLNSSYDDALPHVRVMGISVLYIAPDPTITQPCGAIPGDVSYTQRPPGRAVSPRFVIPLTGIDPRTGKAFTISAPPGKRIVLKSGTTIEVKGFQFGVANAKVKRGARLRWRLGDDVPHNVTLADGPTGFGSKNLDNGRTYTQRFTRPGIYRIFCALHPVQMTETVVVK
jgi:plastocyanin